MKKDSKSTIDSVNQDAVSTIDYLCSQIAERYNLFSSGRPRKAAIVEVLARNPCLGCIDKEFQKVTSQRIDAFYSELHGLASSLVVEALYKVILNRGHSVMITTEENVHFGKIDVFIVPTSFGLNLHSARLEIGIEIKGGYSLSLPQIFRYMLDCENRLLILWRIRNQQVISFHASEVRGLLEQFNKMIIGRADRLLSTEHPACRHNAHSGNWSPNQEQIKETFVDFSHGIVETLPLVLKLVMEALDKEAN